MSFCRDCGLEIDWIRTQSGNMLPVNQEPVFAIEGSGHDGFITDEGELVTGRRAASNEEHNGLLVAFALHRSTCRGGENRSRR